VPVDGVCVPPEAGGVVPPLDGGVEGVAGVFDAGGAPLGTLPLLPSPLLFFFFLSLGVTGSPVAAGGGAGVVSTVVLDLSLPPLEAIATTTIRKKAAATAMAASLRRR
jgi:hypothetical protein